MSITTSCHCVNVNAHVISNEYTASAVLQVFCSFGLLGLPFRERKILCGLVKNLKLDCTYNFQRKNNILVFHNLCPGLIAKLFLKCRNFQPRYSFKGRSRENFPSLIFSLRVLPL